MKLTSQCVLAFDCDSISLVGSYDEAPFGSPREVETNNDLRLWSEGLRQDGGGGYAHYCLAHWYRSFTSS